MAEREAPTITDAIEAAPLRLLHVDDEDCVRRSIARSLGGYGSFEIRGAKSNDEAFAVLADWRPDLIITDLCRPGVDGMRFIARLRSSSATRDIPIVVLSGNAPNYEAALRGLRVEAVLAKPPSTAELFRAVMIAAGRPETAPRAASA